MIKGQGIFLRALEPGDVEHLYQWENDPEVWRVSNTLTPWSRHVLEAYIQSAHQDIYTTKQLRLVICNAESGAASGCIDLFDFEPVHSRAGVGILIAPDMRGKGLAGLALQTLCDYAFGVLHLHQLYAGVASDNTASRKLFESGGFAETGTRKEWIRNGNGYTDEIIYQRISAK